MNSEGLEEVHLGRLGGEETKKRKITKKERPGLEQRKARIQRTADVRLKSPEDKTSSRGRSSERKAVIKGLGTTRQLH